MTDKTIDMTPTWAATLRIYGMALQNPKLDYAGEKNAFDGLMEAAAHLDITYPERCAKLRAELYAAQDALNSVMGKDAFMAEIALFTGPALEAAHDEYRDYADDRDGVEGTLAAVRLDWVEEEMQNRIAA